MLLKRLMILLFVSTIFGCSPTKKLDKNYFRSSKKVGIILNGGEFEITKQKAAFGLTPVGVAINSGIRSALNSVTDERDIEVRQVANKNKSQVEEQILAIFEDEHRSTSKIYKIINIDLDSLNLEEHEPTLIKRKQAFLDYRPLGDLYEVDELLIIDVENFMQLVGLKKNVVFNVTPLVIDMEDNSFTYVSKFSSNYSMLGAWRDSPHYLKLMKVIDGNINEVLYQIRKYFNQ